MWLRIDRQITVIRLKSKLNFTDRFYKDKLKSSSQKLLPLWADFRQNIFWKNSECRRKISQSVFCTEKHLMQSQITGQLQLSRFTTRQLFFITCPVEKLWKKILR